MKVINGRTGAIVRSFFAFGRRYSGGVALAAADLIGDGNAEIIAGRATGQRSVIKVFDSANGQVLQRIVAFRRVRHHGLSLSVREVNGGGARDRRVFPRPAWDTRRGLRWPHRRASRRDPEIAGRPGEVVRRQGVAALIASGERKAFGPCSGNTAHFQRVQQLGYPLILVNWRL